ncbi:hypothetical protein COCNU_08G001140 [Cocos nucifera]|uniref:Uncharacterized protein n=1 Tax=Cocos nucifera TaxID=13894 RepID=A0A8K0IGM1_COCNU|nr:hypothetical protein COCNU_08G001140 [Cocos nucifera]
MTELLGSDRYGRVRDYAVGVTSTQLSDVRRYTQDARESSSNVDVRTREAQMDAWIKERVEARVEAMYDDVISTMRTQIDQLTSML